MANARRLRVLRAKEDTLFKKLLGGNRATIRRLLLRKISRAFFDLRDGGKCVRCGLYVPFDSEFHIDHIDPWASAKNPLAAYFSIANVGISHAACNLRHGASITNSRLSLKNEAAKANSSVQGDSKNEDDNSV